MRVEYNLFFVMLRKRLWVILMIHFANKGGMAALLSSYDLAGVAKYIKSSECKNIALLTGAGKFAVTWF